MATTQYHNQIFNERKRIYSATKKHHNKLNKRHYMTIRRHLCGHMSMSEIAEGEGISVERIRQIIDYAIKKLEAYDAKQDR